MVPAMISEDCTLAASAAAIAANAAGLSTLVWAPFGRQETGWVVYYPRIAVELGTTCAAVTPGFATKLAAWQRRHGLAATGALDPQTFAAMKSAWQGARPFVRLDARTHCPPPSPAETLVTAAPGESYGGKTIRLRAGTLIAYRAMIAAAKRDRGVAAEPQSLVIFSAFRDPASDAARCATEHNCNGIVRATCSPHRTGLALDIWVGHAEGFGPDSSVDSNRRAMVRTPAYRWLLVNAKTYGFVNYVFEPWHWEWTGETI